MSMSEPWWKNAIEIAAAIVVIVTAVFIEKYLRTDGDGCPATAFEPDSNEERPRSGESKAEDR
jgi:hypothetical protein